MIEITKEMIYPGTFNPQCGYIEIQINKHKDIPLVIQQILKWQEDSKKLEKIINLKNTKTQWDGSEKYVEVIMRHEIEKILNENLVIKK